MVKNTFKSVSFQNIPLPMLEDDIIQYDVLMMLVHKAVHNSYWSGVMLKS